MIGRRAFLGFLGASPIAGKKAIQEAARATSNDVVKGEVETDGILFGEPPDEVLEQIERAVKRHGIPVWKQQDIIREANNWTRKYGLDADLRAMVSMSGIAKARIQQKRNIRSARLEALAELVSQEDSKKWHDRMRKTIGENFRSFYWG